MISGKTSGTIFLLFLVNSLLLAQRIQVLDNVGANACPGSLTNCASANPVRLTVVTNLPGDPLNLPFNPTTPHDSPRRFKGFWIMGDGNFLQFPDTYTDAESRTPPPYNYAKPGNYQVTTYLTGKYSNNDWPKQAVMQVNNTLTPASTPTAFTPRLLKGNEGGIDIISNHAIRKKNLTAFVISYARAKQSSGVYFFYNGVIDVHDPARSRHRSDFPILKHTDTELPLYFDGKLNAGKIKSYDSRELTKSGSVDGITFTNVFSELHKKFRDVIYFPAETAVAGDLPADFLEKRFFPILQADSAFTPKDTLMNFLVVLTGREPVKNAALDSLLVRLSQGLSLGTPINTLDNENRRTDNPDYISDNVRSEGPQYIQAIDEYPLAYQVTFDPNQLTVEDIKPSGVAGEYEVRFRLEMCNKGQANVDSEMVSIRYSTNFHDFKALSPSIIHEVHNGQTWQFTSNEIIVGVLPEAHESECVAIEFTAKTNCDGVRSLWHNSPQQPVESCVVFSGAIDDRPECHLNFSIDSTHFTVDGKGICCRDGPSTCPLNWLVWLFLFIASTVLFVIRKIFRRSQS